MKRFVLSCFLSAGLFAASRNENLQTIVEKSYLQETASPFINMLAVQAAGQSNKSVDTEALVAEFRQEILKSGRMEKFFVSYKDVFTDEEIADLRAIFEKPVWQKFVKETPLIAQVHIQLMRDLFQELIDKMDVAEQVEHSSNVVTITKETADQITSSETPVILDVQAKWCPPCQMMNPILEELAEKYQDQLQFMKVDIDEHPEIAQEFGVKSLPTLIFLKPGDKTPALKQVGFLAKKDLEEKIETFLETLPVDAEDQE